VTNVGTKAQRDESGSKPPTMLDVAREANVSVQTVSNVLNTPAVVNEATKTRVLDAITRLGYRRNRAARSLRGRSSHLIGYCIQEPTPGTVDALLDEFVHSFTKTASHSGYGLLLVTADGIEAELAVYDELWVTQAIDGIVLSGIEHNDPRISALRDRQIPFVAFGRSHVAVEHSWVDVDGQTGVRLGVEHLVELGHRRVAFLGWAADSGNGEDRLSGWRAGCVAAGLPHDDRLIGRAGNNIVEARAAIKVLMKGRQKPTAVVCASDTLAIGAYQGLRDLGLRPGVDVSVIGYDDSPAAVIVEPPLTSVRQPVDDVGQAVFAELHRRLSGEPAAQHLYAPRLVVRDSSCAVHRL
jgi:DNA-binding LacI/PurR family transcriptional regulator